MDLTTLAGIAAATLGLVEVAKKAMPSLKGYEAQMAVLLPLALGALSKAMGVGLMDMSWLEAMVGLALSSAGAQVAHDKLMNPLMKKDAK